MTIGCGAAASRVAIEARHAGHEPAMRDGFERALATDPDEFFARDALGDRP